MGQLDKTNIWGVSGVNVDYRAWGSNKLMFIDKIIDGGSVWP